MHVHIYEYIELQTTVTTYKQQQVPSSTYDEAMTFKL